MSAVTDRGELMNHGACMDMPPEVVDKYFGASMIDDAFSHYTARAICGHCAVRAACLADAIASPAVFGDSESLVRAGEPGIAISAMRRRHFLSGEPVPAIVMDALRQQQTGRRTGDIPFLRAGNFSDAQLFEGPLR